MILLACSSQPVFEPVTMPYHSLTSFSPSIRLFRICDAMPLCTAEMQSQ